MNGTSLPSVDFDVGESYAGLLPIGSANDTSNQLYFWFFPSTNMAAQKEIMIWVTGGVRNNQYPDRRLLRPVRLTESCSHSRGALRSESCSRRTAPSSGSPG